jgi:hypothetical protein
MIANRRYRIIRSEVAGLDGLPELVGQLAGRALLRWYVGEVTAEELVVEATLADDEVQPIARTVECVHPGRSAVLSIIPTGVGCAVGGYAGDAGPATSLLAAAVDYLVTNPNAVNASDFVALAPNVLYTEGYMIDLFCQRAIELHVPYANRVGLVVERSPTASLDVAFNVLNAVRAVHGVDIEDVVVTEQSAGNRCFRNESGAFVGTVDRPGVILEACEKLVRRGINAIALTTSVQDLPLEDYARHFAGKCPNPIGGAEAILSHLVVRHFRVPAAHAPLLNWKDLELADRVVDARGAGEMVSTSGLACVLLGLRRAPQLDPEGKGPMADVINRQNLLALVTPATCLGGIPALHARRAGIPILAVRGNETILDVTAEALGMSGVIEVGSYAEAAGLVLALRQGISLCSLTRPLATLRHSGGREREHLDRAALPISTAPGRAAGARRQIG